MTREDSVENEHVSLDQALQYAQDISQMRAGALARRMAQAHEAPKLVLVDDDRQLRLLITATLASEGYDIIDAANGEDALRAIQEHSPNLVLLDVRLPDISGVEVCRRIRQDERLKDLPIIMLTALGDSESRAEGQAAGATLYMTKPFHPMELLTVIDALIKLR